MAPRHQTALRERFGDAIIQAVQLARRPGLAGQVGDQQVTQDEEGEGCGPADQQRPASMLVGPPAGQRSQHQGGQAERTDGKANRGQTVAQRPGLRADGDDDLRILQRLLRTAA